MPSMGKAIRPIPLVDAGTALALNALGHFDVILPVEQVTQFPFRARLMGITNGQGSQVCRLCIDISACSTLD
jgi:hypothetical protein